MTKEARKQNKAVEKIRKSIRKAIGKGVSQSVIEGAVEKAMAKAADIDPDTSESAEVVKSEAKKISGLPKTGDITLKRGVVDTSEKPSLKRLPGKTEPPTLTLKRGKNP